MFLNTSLEKKIYSSIHKRNVERVYFLKSFRKLVEKYKYIFLFPHINPDGDCIGGVLGFKEVLKQNYPNKKIFAVGSNFGLFEGWLRMEFDRMPNGFDFSQALAVTIDVGVKSRIQEYSQYFEEAKTKFGDVVKIDHHESLPDIHFDLSWDDGTYVAACVQLFQIADYYNWTVTPKAATYLYLGMYTDSQRFLFPSTVARSLVMAAKSWRAGADYKLIHKQLTLRTWDSIKVDQYLLANGIKEENIIWFHITKEIMEKQNIKHTKGIVNVYQNIMGIRLWLMFTDNPDGTIQVEFRSVGPDVRTLAMQFGGGGHENAAGTVINDPSLIPTIVAAAKEKAKEGLDEDLSRKKNEWEAGFIDEDVHYYQEPEASETILEAEDILNKSKEELAVKIEKREIKIEEKKEPTQKKDSVQNKEAFSDKKEEPKEKEVKKNSKKSKS